jgi:FlaA1/EpsC-like NDP-sugar epimerase
VFEALLLPWTAFPWADIAPVRHIIETFYAPELLSTFDLSVEFNTNLFVRDHSGQRMISRKTLHTVLHTLRNDRLLLYGAGAQAREIVAFLTYLQITGPLTIWDMRAAQIGGIDGVNVHDPDFESRAPQDAPIMLITIADTNVAAQVRAQFEPLGYTVCHGLREYMRFCTNL